MNSNNDKSIIPARIWSINPIFLKSTAVSSEPISIPVPRETQYQQYHHHQTQQHMLPSSWISQQTNNYTSHYISRPVLIVPPPSPATEIQSIAVEMEGITLDDTLPTVQESNALLETYMKERSIRRRMKLNRERFDVMIHAAQMNRFKEKEFC